MIVTALPTCGPQTQLSMQHVLQLRILQLRDSGESRPAAGAAAAAAEAGLAFASPAPIGCTSMRVQAYTARCLQQLPQQPRASVLTSAVGTLHVPVPVPTGLQHGPPLLVP